MEIPTKSTGAVEIDLFQILVDELHIHVIRQGCGKDHRPVGGQMKFRLPLQLGPAGVDQLELHGLTYR